MSGRQLFLKAVGASYWRSDNGVATFLRYEGEPPADLEAAKELVHACVDAGSVRYIWLQGKMTTVSVLWD